ncbi:hypothetical protein UA08_03236 [Talaromyces atroroseus]|uniref:SGNH hydrolase-type esterase domain-containing protein n=1 Tax=Talaromyces atroroseus TaxID=1441469 RepID=A0A225ASM3_TALAT|nr:hypothetical protein UA08_03236 [Talaromyces atroroseus]OKL61344.1 hypothetical protein UA08_03236 [Talaromyces atroroseus]
MQQHWVHSWAAMQQPAKATNLPSESFTLRQTARLSLGTSSHIRLRLSNAFGDRPLTIAKATIARSADNASGTNAVQPDTLHPLTFSGDPEACIPAGALVVSDPINIGGLPPATAVSISLFLPDGQLPGGIVTLHPGSRTTSWYYISGIEILVPRESSAFVLIGDSITDGRGSKTNGDTRWPDLLFSRLQTQPHEETSNSAPSISLINQSAGGNCVLEDSSGGPSVLARLDRDVLSLSGVRFAMIFEGVNDIGIAPPDPKIQAIIEKRLIAGYVQIATRLKAAGIFVAFATLTPFGAPREEDEGSNRDTTPYSHPVRELTRQRVNNWIRGHSPAVFDAVVDFDAVLRDPEDSSVLAREYDSGDHLHPNQAAFQALANHFPIDVFCL